MAYIVSKNVRTHSYRIQDGGKTLTLITILGGAGVADKKTLVAPEGVITNVGDKDLELLKNCPEFKRHLDDGLVKIITNANDKDKVAKDLKANDKSAPLKESDLSKISTSKEIKE